MLFFSLLFFILSIQTKNRGLSGGYALTDHAVKYAPLNTLPATALAEKLAASPGLLLKDE